MKTSHFLERAGQITFIVMCAVVTAVGIKYLGSTERVEAAPPAPYAPGASLPGIAKLNPQGAAGILVLGLSNRCRFCTESMEFYRRIAAHPKVSSADLQISVVSVEPERPMREYLSRQALNVSVVVPMLDIGFTMSGTPTLVLADGAGKVVASWEGLLDAEREQDVLRRVADVLDRR